MYKWVDNIVKRNLVLFYGRKELYDSYGSVKIILRLIKKPNVMGV